MTAEQMSKRIASTIASRSRQSIRRGATSRSIIDRRNDQRLPMQIDSNVPHNEFLVQPCESSETFWSPSNREPYQQPCWRHWQSSAWVEEIRVHMGFTTLYSKVIVQ